MEHTAEIYADISCREAPKVIYSKQGDEGTRFVRVRFLNGGAAFDMTQAVSTEIRVLKPDGRITINPGVLDGDGGLYPLSDQSLNVGGEGRAEFMLYGADGELISTVPARLVITASPAGDEAAASTNEFSELNRRVTAVEGQLNGMSIMRLTQAAYESILHDEDTLYFVEGRNGTDMYLGDVELAGGSIPAGAALAAEAVPVGTAGHGTFEEV